MQADHSTASPATYPVRPDTSRVHRLLRPAASESEPPGPPPTKLVRVGRTLRGCQSTNNFDLMDITLLPRQWQPSCFKSLFPRAPPRSGLLIGTEVKVATSGISAKDDWELCTCAKPTMTFHELLNSPRGKSLLKVRTRSNHRRTHRLAYSRHRYAPLRAVSRRYMEADTEVHVPHDGVSEGGSGRGAGGADMGPRRVPPRA